MTGRFVSTLLILSRSYHTRALLPLVHPLWIPWPSIIRFLLHLLLSHFPNLYNQANRIYLSLSRDV